MPSLHEQFVSPYSPAQVFALVADIERYPEFLPWCRSIRILEREGNTMLAQVMVAHKQFRESYVCRVTLTPPHGEPEQGEIEVDLVEGPLHHLHNHWRFKQSADGGANIDFSLNFKLRSMILEKMVGLYLPKATTKMCDAFAARSQALYGPAAAQA